LKSDKGRRSRKARRALA